MQISTPLKASDVALRQRALKMGFTLNEYSLAKSETKAGRAQNEEEIDAKLELDFIPSNCARIWEKLKPPPDTLPVLIELSDIRGDADLHTVETDAATPLRRWRRRRGNAATVHGDRRSLEKSRLRQRPHRRAPAHHIERIPQSKKR